MLNLDDLTYKIRLDPSEVDQASAHLEQRMTRLAGAAAPVQRGFEGVARSSALTRQQLLTLQYTTNDVLASLSSGASPLTILAQQGGQVTQAFGGLRGTFSALGQAITVGRVAITGMAAAVGVLALGFVEGMRESDAFTKAVGRSGNMAGLTEDAYRRLNRAVADASGQTAVSAREIVNGLVAGGQIGARALGDVAIAASAMAKAYDLSAEQVVKDFNGMAGGVAKWAAEHNRSMNFITVEQYRYIRSLEEQGRVSEAQIYVAQRVREASERVTSQLGPLERAWGAVKRVAGEAWDAMLGGGRRETLEQRIEQARKLVESAQRGVDDPESVGPYRGRSISGRERLANAQENLRLLLRSQAAQRSITESQADAAERNQRAIEAERKAEGTRTKSQPRDYFNEAQDRLEERFRIALDRVADSEVEAAEKLRRQEEQDYARRLAAGEQLQQQIVEMTMASNASIISDDQARGLAQIAIEKAALTARIQALGLYPEQAAALQGKAAAYILARERQLTEELKPEIDKRLELYADFNRYMTMKSDEFRDGFVDSSRDAFREFVRTGRLSADNVAAYIRNKLADAIFDQFLAKGAANLGGAIFSGLTGLFGGGGLSVSTVGATGITSGSVGLVDLGLGGGRAGGGSVRPWSLQPVTEMGPELLRAGGRNYLMMGNDWGHVTPAGETARALGGGGGKQVIDASTTIGSVGAGVSRAELNVTLRNRDAQLEKRLRRLIGDGRV